MAVELFVYSPSSTILTSEELTQQLRSVGWETRLILDQGTKDLVHAPPGPLTDLLDVIGWPSSSEKGDFAADAIDRRDFKSLQSLYDEASSAPAVTVLSIHSHLRKNLSMRISATTMRTSNRSRNGAWRR